MMKKEDMINPTSDFSKLYNDFVAYEIVKGIKNAVIYVINLEILSKLYKNIQLL